MMQIGSRPPSQLRGDKTCVVQRVARQPGMSRADALLCWTADVPYWGQRGGERGRGRGRKRERFRTQQPPAGFCPASGTLTDYFQIGILRDDALLRRSVAERERALFNDDQLAWVRLSTEMIHRAGLAPCRFEFPFAGGRALLLGAQRGLQVPSRQYGERAKLSGEGRFVGCSCQRVGERRQVIAVKPA